MSNDTETDSVNKQSESFENDDRKPALRWKLLQPLQIPTTIYFPFTTRGFGFATQRIFDIAQECKPHQQITVQKLYRITLFQLENQLTLASDLAHDTPLDIVPSRNLLPVNYRTSIARNVCVNLSVLSEFINLCGNFQQFNHYYTPYVPRNVMWTADVQFEMAEQQGPELRRARPPRVQNCQRTVNRVNYPDPYTVSFSTLRSVIDFISNPATNIEVRSYFHDRNPLPGAVWEDDVLTNPQAFLPQNEYTANDLLDDYDCLLTWTRKLKGKYSDLFSECNFSGIGHNCQLVSSKVEASLIKTHLNIKDVHHTGENSPRFSLQEIMENSNHADCATTSRKEKQTIRQEEYRAKIGAKVMQEYTDQWTRELFAGLEETEITDQEIFRSTAPEGGDESLLYAGVGLLCGETPDAFDNVRN